MSAPLPDGHTVSPDNRTPDDVEADRGCIEKLATPHPYLLSDEELSKGLLAVADKYELYYTARLDATVRRLGDASAALSFPDTTMQVFIHTGPGDSLDAAALREFHDRTQDDRGTLVLTTREISHDAKAYRNRHELVDYIKLEQVD